MPYTFYTIYSLSLSLVVCATMSRKLESPVIHAIKALVPSTYKIHAGSGNLAQAVKYFLIGILTAILIANDPTITIEEAWDPAITLMGFRGSTRLKFEADNRHYKKGRKSFDDIPDDVATYVKDSVEDCK